MPLDKHDAVMAKTTGSLLGLSNRYTTACAMYVSWAHLCTPLCPFYFHWQQKVLIHGGTFTCMASFYHVRMEIVHNF